VPNWLHVCVYVVSLDGSYRISGVHVFPWSLSSDNKSPYHTHTHTATHSNTHTLTHTHTWQFYPPIDFWSTGAAWSQSLVVLLVDSTHTHTHARTDPQETELDPRLSAGLSIARGIGLRIIDGCWSRAQWQAKNAARARQVRAGVDVFVWRGVQREAALSDEKS